MSRKKHPAITVAFIFVLLCTFYFGLKPKGYRFINQVRHDENGLSFYNIGMVYSEKPLGDFGCQDSLFIAAIITPYRTGSILSRLITIVDENGYKLFTIDQWKKELEVSLWDTTGNRLTRKGIRNVLAADSENFFAAGINNGVVWICGKNKKRVCLSEKHTPINLSSCHLLIGFGPSGENPWHGKFKSLALDSKMPDSIALSTILLTSTGNDSGTQSLLRGMPLFFDFTTPAAGTRINCIGTKIWPLTKPKLPRFFRHLAPEIIPTHISDIKGFIVDMLVNFIGFIPVGFSSFLLLTNSAVFRKQTWTISILLIICISFFIEFVQIFIPTRSAQLLDLLLNTTGGALGTLGGKYFRQKQKVARS